MPDVDCARPGTSVDRQDRHATMETDVKSDGEAVEPSARSLRPDCYEDLLERPGTGGGKRDASDRLKPGGEVPQFRHLRFVDDF